MIPHMRVVLDTNVLIDGFADDFSYPARLIDAANQGQLTALVTPAIIREYRLILKRLINDLHYQRKIENFFERAEPVPAVSVNVVIDDSEDEKFLEAALGGKADLIVSKDQHLLTLESLDKTLIVTPETAWNLYEADTNTGGSDWLSLARNLGIGLFLFVGLFLPGLTLAAEAEDLQSEITALDQKITELRSQRDTTAAEQDLINAQIKRLEKTLEQTQASLGSTKQELQTTTKEAQATTATLGDLEQKIATAKDNLRQLVRALYQQEQESLLKAFIRNWSLSEVMSEHTAYQILQARTAALIHDLRLQEEELARKEQELKEQQSDLLQLQRLQTAQTATLASQRQEQSAFLQKKQVEQATYEHLLAEAKQAREEIAQQVFSLQSSGQKVEVKLNDAVSVARYVSEKTGVRPALLLAVLKVESNLGKSVGTGSFPGDMHPLSIEPFKRLTAKLGLDPYATPISLGGGAIGPGQFLPQTWETLEGRVASLLGQSLANPFELTDAMLGTGLYLADRGAGNPASEYEAVGRYISPNWQKFTWYIDRVLAVAKEYEASF
jgi:putative PIN family toxin of toxin-antitoxin system